MREDMVSPCKRINLEKKLAIKEIEAKAEFRRGQQQPCDDREHFNRTHSSLRSIIERTFGVWKNRFGFLALMSWYEMPTQAFENLPDEDLELEDILDDRDDIVDEGNVPEMNDMRNNIRSALRRLQRHGNRVA
ncbi:hypothetical protein RHSIM_RhsimUnG0182500 [Rhododendron simsii]|uniref:DDE Tnp4 domain-containing protein n=1 Tax=Rhododendron simsii TaxID=118357 RepID=A0A834FZE6_RHOSS|nr:hypothetical protein RHSIM_RhsimUnG0182500 [Rhododendron simsii]